MEQPMPTFSFEVRNAAGRPQTGREDAASAAALVSALRGRGWLVLSVREVAGGAAGFSLNPLRLLRVRSVDIEFSLNQIAVMLRSGLTLLTAIRTAAEQAR